MKPVVNITDVEINECSKLKIDVEEIHQDGLRNLKDIKWKLDSIAPNQDNSHLQIIQKILDKQQKVSTNIGFDIEQMKIVIPGKNLRINSEYTFSFSASNFLKNIGITTFLVKVVGKVPMKVSIDGNKV